MSGSLDQIAPHPQAMHNTWETCYTHSVTIRVKCIVWYGLLMDATLPRLEQIRLFSSSSVQPRVYSSFLLNIPRPSSPSPGLLMGHSSALEAKMVSSTSGRSSLEENC